MCFFSPHTDALTPLRSQATPDRAPDHLADGTPTALRDDLISLLGPTAVQSRVTDLVKYATDASHLFPGLHQEDFRRIEVVSPQRVASSSIRCGLRASRASIVYST
jgi:hypothetical protein